MSCCTPFCAAAGTHFDARIAARDLARYRAQGPGSTARLLRDGLTSLGVAGETLLDVGAGIGALTFELLKNGIGRATAVEASQAYLAAVREEAARCGQSARVEFRYGDFVELAPQLERADVVTLDRVVCCYPAYASLLTRAAQLAGRSLAASYPKDRWYVRLVVAFDNALRRITGSPFRTFVHPAAAMQAVVERSGFRLADRRTTLAWSADVYVRTGAG